MPAAFLSEAHVATAVFEHATSDASFDTARRRSLLEGSGERIQLGKKASAQVAEIVQSQLHAGLRASQVEQRFREFGPNVLQKSQAKPYLRILLEQLNLMNLLMLMAASICFMSGIEINGETLGEQDTTTGLVFVSIVAACIYVGAYMEWSCYTALADVGKLSMPVCEVIRDGERHIVQVPDVVPGDLLALNAGDVVAADARLVEVSNLLTNEVHLTGEIHDVSKTVNAVNTESPFPSNMVYATTHVTSGVGKALVVKTGMATEMGKIAQHLKVEEFSVTPLQRTMNRIARTVTCCMVFIVSCIFLVSFLRRIDDPSSPCLDKFDTMCYLRKSCFRSLFCAVGVIPETLQPAVMFLLVMGVRLMKRKKALMRRLSAVDALGSCSYVCCDKTGTLTEGKITCTRLLPLLRMGTKKVYAFWPAQGCDPRGGIYDRSELTREAKNSIGRKFSGRLVVEDLPENFGSPDNKSSEARLVQSIMLALYCNSHEARLVKQRKGQYRVEGNMSEGALLVAAAKAGITKEATRAQYPREEDLEVPFSSTRKAQATVHRLNDKGHFEAMDWGSQSTHVAIIKGAPDVLRPFCKSVLTSVGDVYRISSEEFEGSDHAWVESTNATLSSNALRVLSLCMVPLAAEDVAELRRHSTSDERLNWLLSAHCTFVSLVAMMDAPRRSTKAAVRKCHRAGLRVAMITGDQLPTAAAIARIVGILPSTASEQQQQAQEEHLAADCARLRECGDDVEAIDDLCSRIVVWGRAQPEDKVTIVQSLQRLGHVVAMSGDGVNDVGALIKADIGIAMGNHGTEVAKGASDILLVDDNFATIVDVVAEGRRIFENVQKMAAYLLCVNIMEVVVVFIAMLLGWAVPLEEDQLFKANLVTHEFYPWCMVWEAPDYYSMRQPPRDRRKQLIPRLMRTVLIPLSLLLYGFTMLMTQLIGSQWHCRTVRLKTMMGAVAISEFRYGSYPCLHAHTWRARWDGKVAWVKDKAPLLCSIGDIQQYGQGGKLPLHEAVAQNLFDVWTGQWGDMFTLQSSFLNESLPSVESAIATLSSPGWSDPHGFLVKCRGGTDRSVGDGDKLCWQLCDGEPCWKKTYLRRDGELDEEDDDEEDEDEPAKPVLYNKYNVRDWGCRKMRSMVLMTMVLMEFAMLFGFAKHDFGLTLVNSNKAFPRAWGPMLALLHFWVYCPVTIWDNHFAPLDMASWLMCIVLAVSFYMGLEGAKVLHRRWFREMLQGKVVAASMTSSGRAAAFAPTSVALGVAEGQSGSGDRTSRGARAALRSALGLQLEPPSPSSSPQATPLIEVEMSRLEASSDEPASVHHPPHW